jgi:hypothetical protein
VSAVDDWLDGEDVDLVAALADPAARRDVVELALVEALLPKAPPPRRHASPRTAAIAALVVAIAMIAVLLLLPRQRHDDGALVRAEDHTRIADSDAVVVAVKRRVVDTPIGVVTLAPATRALIRATSSPAALYVDVIAGEATIGAEVLRAGARGVYGDRMARRRLGPRVVVELLRIDARRLEARLASGETKSYVVSSTVAIETRAARGDTVELILSPDEHEVFVVKAIR